jgi:hypothetical protein
MTKNGIFGGLAAVALIAISSIVWSSCRDKTEYAANKPDNAVSITTDGTKPLGSAPSNKDDLPRDVILWRVFIGETEVGSNRIIEVKYVKVATHELQQGEGIDNYLKQVVLGQAPNNWRDVPELVGDAQTYAMSPLSIRHTGYAYMVFVLDEKNWQFTAEREPFAVQRGKQDYYLDAKCAWRTGATTAEVQAEPPANAECKVASFISNAALDRKEPTFKEKFRTPFNFYVSLKLPRKNGTLYLPLAIDPDVGYPGGSHP